MEPKEGIGGLMNCGSGMEPKEGIGGLMNCGSGIKPGGPLMSCAMGPPAFVG